MFNRVALISSAQLSLIRAPAALAFMAGVCERNNTDYQVWDLNSELRKRLGNRVWSEANPYSSNNLDELPVDLKNQINDFLSEIVHEIKQACCDAIAVSTFSYMQNQWCELFLRCCRAALPTVPIVIGGPGVGSPYKSRDTLDSFGRWAVDNSLCNYYVLGEGDEAFEAFLHHREFEGLNSQSTPDLWAPQIEDLDQNAVNSYSKISLEDYVGPRNRQVITLNGSRGCVRRCTFCDVGAIWKRFRFRSGQSLADEMLKHWQDSGVTDFWFNDSLINGSIKQFMELLETLDNYQQQYTGFQDLTFSGQFIIRPQQSHPERMYQLMSRVGCNHLAVGVESGSESVRHHMGKKFSNQDIDYHLEMCERYQITNFMLSLVGYPTETREDFEATLEMFSRYQRYVINQTILGISLKYTMTILPDTPIEAMQSDLGIEWIHGDNYALEWRPAVNPELTVQERYQRWIDLTRHAVDLGYSLGEEALEDIAANHRRVKSMQSDHLSITSGHTNIPLQKAPAAVLS